MEQKSAVREVDTCNILIEVLKTQSKALPPSQLACRLLLCDFRRRHVKAIQGFKMKLKVVCRKVYDYVRYDLKEIAFPSSLPDPPDIKKRRKLTWKESYLVLKEASRLYAASWVRDIGPELRPNDYKKKQYTDDMDHEENDTSKGKEPSTLEDLAVAARGGMETLRPALQRVYMTRASAYRDALKSFIVGYQEGIQQVMDKKEEATKSQEEKDVNKGP